MPWTVIHQTLGGGGGGKPSPLLALILSLYCPLSAEFDTGVLSSHRRGYLAGTERTSTQVTAQTRPPALCRLVPCWWNLPARESRGEALLGAVQPCQKQIKGLAAVQQSPSVYANTFLHAVKACNIWLAWILQGYNTGK